MTGVHHSKGFLDWSLREAVPDGRGSFTRNILDGYGDSYVIKPGVEYRESEAFLAEEGLYLVRVRFYSDKEHITEYKLITVGALMSAPKPRLSQP
jgi:hypothetical protein